MGDVWASSGPPRGDLQRHAGSLLAKVAPGQVIEHYLETGVTVQRNLWQNYQIRSWNFDKQEFRKRTVESIRKIANNKQKTAIFLSGGLDSTFALSCIKDMEKAYFKEKTKNTLLVVNKILSFDQKLGGDFNLNNNILKKENNNNFIYTGCQMINKNLFLKLSNQSFSILDIWNDLLLQNKLFGHESKNKFYHVTDLRIYQELLKN